MEGLLIILGFAALFLIVAAMGGRLDVVSTAGQGTSIKISLPCAKINEHIPLLTEAQSSQA